MAEEISGGGYARQKVSWSSASAGQITSTHAATFPTRLAHPARLACEDPGRCGINLCWRAVEPCPPMDLPADRTSEAIEEWLES